MCIITSAMAWGDAVADAPAAPGKDTGIEGTGSGGAEFKETARLVPLLRKVASSMQRHPNVKAVRRAGPVAPLPFGLAAL
ncbi:hypothetical protein [Azospirillum doebereinerae]